jgi:hypothetical protein
MERSISVANLGVGPFLLGLHTRRQTIVSGFITAAALVLITPAVVEAGPCVPNSLAAYIALGTAGCSVGSATINDFSINVFDPHALPIAAANIFVTPVELGDGLRLDFGVTQNATAGQFFDATIGYSLSAVGSTSALLTVHGATATPDGVVTAVEDVCLGGTFVSNVTNCSAVKLSSLIAFQDGFGDSGLTDQKLFTPRSFLDVFTEIAIDAGTKGTAGLNGIVSNEFRTAGPMPIPEPSTVFLLGAGLLYLVRRRRCTADRPRPSAIQHRRRRTQCEKREE